MSDFYNFDNGENIKLEDILDKETLLKSLKTVNKPKIDLLDLYLSSECIVHNIVEKTLDDLLHPDLNVPIRVGIIGVHTSASGSNIGLIESLILDAASSNKYHVVVAPEYSFLSKNGPISEVTKDKYVEVFRKASEGGKFIIPGTFVWKQDGNMFNTAYVFYDGKVLFNYNKNIDGGELSIANKHSLTPIYGRSPGIFNWVNLKVGIEICADSGVLSDGGILDRDLVFLISSGNAAIFESMQSVRLGGYGVLAEGFFRTYDAKQQTKTPKAYSPTRLIDFTHLMPEFSKSHFSEKIIPFDQVRDSYYYEPGIFSDRPLLIKPDFTYKLPQEKIDRRYLMDLKQCSVRT